MGVVVRVDEAGRLLLPSETGIRPGDTIEVAVMDDGAITLRPRRGTLEGLVGLLRRPGPALSPEEMDEAIAEAVLEANPPARR